MAINLNQLTSGQVIELASHLDKRERYRAVRQLLYTLDSRQLEDLEVALAHTLTEVLLEEQENELELAKFAYKRIPPSSNNHYAYIRQWAREEFVPNIYIGKMQFMPDKVYQLTHKVTSETQTLAGLGLYRDGEQVYLKLHHLTPVDKVESYLFYDKTLRFPRRPQEDNIEAFFSKKQWKIECLGTLEEFEASQKQSHPRLESLSQEAPQAKKLTPRQPKKFIAPDLASPTAIKEQDKPLPAKITVQKKFVPQVKAFLEQWEKFSHLLSSHPQWRLRKDSNGLTLQDSQGKAILEYNTTSGTLTTSSAHALHDWLEEIMFAVAKSQLVNEKQQSVASRWLTRLKSAPLQNSDKLLAYLFNL
jgi:hypothetical protein